MRVTNPRTTSAAAAALIAASAMTLSGCGLIQSQGEAVPPTALETCVLGTTWMLDTDVAADQTWRQLNEQGVTVLGVTVEGSEAVAWNEDHTVEVTDDLTVTVTLAGAAPETPIVIVQTLRGVSTGQAWFAANVAIPREWNAQDFVATTTATTDGAPVDPLPVLMPTIAFNDIVGLEASCSADTLSLHGRGTHRTLTYHPVGWTPPAPAPTETEEPAAQE